MAINLLNSKIIKKKERFGQIQDFFKSPEKKPELEKKEDDFSFESESKLFLETHARSAHLRWQAPEFEKSEWDRKWYLGAIIILAVIILYALVSNNPIVAITFILIGVVGYLFLQKNPRIMDFMITPQGVIVGNEIYEYRDIKSFWIFYELHFKVISLRMDGKIMPHIHIPLGNEDPVKVREALIKYIPEIEQRLTMIDIIEKVFRI